MRSRLWAVIMAGVFWTQSVLYASDREGMMRAFSSNQSVIQRLRQESHSTLLDAKAKSKIEQKISILSNTNQNILLNLIKEGSRDEESSLSAARWLHMVPQDKERYVFSQVSELEERWGVKRTKPSMRYAQAMDDILARDPTWEKKPLSWLLNYVLIKSEPTAHLKLKDLIFKSARD